MRDLGDDGRPDFAKDFPRVASVDGLIAAFGRGDYAEVRAQGRRLAGSDAESDAVRRAARTLVSRTQPDPLSIWLLVMTGVLLAALSLYWVAHGRAPSGRAPVPPASST
jgi:hypothetical protein